MHATRSRLHRRRVEPEAAMATETATEAATATETATEAATATETATEAATEARAAMGLGRPRGRQRGR